MRLAVHWFGESARDWPARAETRFDAPGGHSKAALPLRNRKRLAAEGDAAVRPRIVGLSLGERPPAVPGLVVPVGIDSVDRVLLGGGMAKISQKRFKGVRPLGAHRDSATTVKVVVGIVRVLAALLSASPRAIFATGRHAVCSPCPTEAPPSLATTTLGGSGPQLDANNVALCAAVTQASPGGIHGVRLIRRAAYYGEVAESLARKVYAIISTVRYAVFPHSRHVSILAILRGTA